MMKPFWTVLALLPLLLSLSANATPPKKHMTPEEVRKEFSEPGHIPQSPTLHPFYQPLNDIIPKTKQQRIDARKRGRLMRKESLKGKPHTSLWDHLFPSAYAFGRHPDPAPTVAPSAIPAPLVSSSPSPLPTVGSGAVDFRSCDTPIKTQLTPRCTAFAATAAMENSVCNQVSLAPDHLWRFYEIYSIDSAIPATLNLITTAAEWPPNGNPVTGYQAFAKTHTVTYTELDDQDAAVVALQAGHRVVWGGTVPQDMASGRATIRYTTGATSGGHSIEVVGYQPDSTIQGGGYFILKNSWGTDNGDNGYQYYPLGLCDKAGFYCAFYSLNSVKVDP
jgi:hypothetical protein